jgi:hypothetical protein
VKTFFTLIPAFFLALGFASCGNDVPEDAPTGVLDNTSLTITHPNYSNGALSVIVGKPVAIGASHVEVSMNVPQDYTLEFVPEENEYFTFTGEGVLTGLKEGDDVGDITVRVVAASGKTLVSKLISVNVVGMLVTITGNASYVNDTFRVTANEEFLLRKTNVSVEPDDAAYTIAFAPKETRYFAFAATGQLRGVLDGTGTIEVLVLKGSDTLKVQPFNVKVAPNPAWVTAVTVTGSRTRYMDFMSGETEKTISLKEDFRVEGGATQTLRFSSSDAEVATVDENTGEVIVKNVPSYAFIRATAIDGSERADSIRVTAARIFPGNSCDWNLCNILSSATKEDVRYMSCNVWDGDVATAWVYRVNTPFPCGNANYVIQACRRYEGVQFLMGKYGKDPDPEKEEYNLMAPDWVLGGENIPKKETNWGVWAGNMDATQHLTKLIVRRGFYTDERGKKIFQSGTMYLEFWSEEEKKMRTVGKHTFTDDPNDSEWVVDLTQITFEVWTKSTDGNFTKEPQVENYPNGKVPVSELQMMFSSEGALAASDGSYYWAIADVLLFE